MAARTGRLSTAARDGPAASALAGLTRRRVGRPIRHALTSGRGRTGMTTVAAVTATSTVVTRRGSHTGA